MNPVIVKVASFFERFGLFNIVFEWEAEIVSLLSASVTWGVWASFFGILYPGLRVRAATCWSQAMALTERLSFSFSLCREVS